jgi:hypothetical protein
MMLIDWTVLIVLAVLFMWFGIKRSRWREA